MGWTTSRGPRTSTGSPSPGDPIALSPGSISGALSRTRPCRTPRSRVRRAVAALDRISIAAIGDTAADLTEEASVAEAAGIDCVWTPELFRSSVTQATWLAANTERVGVGTGIAWAFTRSAFILAVTALDIDEMSGGRFRLGLGAGVKRLNETWHGVDYGKPAPHLRETVEAVRLIMEKASSGGRIRSPAA